jgi:hypothetical protein
MNIPSISAVLDTAAQAAINDALDDIFAKLAFGVNLTKEQKRRILKMSTKYEGYVNGIHTTAKTFSGTIPSDYTFTDFTKDQDLNAALEPIVGRITALAELIKDTMLVLGHQRLGRANDCYGFLTEGSKGNEPLSEILAGLSVIFDRAPGQKPVAYDIPAGSTVSIYNVKPGTLFVNTGTTVVKFKAGAELSGKVRIAYIMVTPGDAETIPDGWAVIEVVNESTTTAGSFKVRHRS